MQVPEPLWQSAAPWPSFRVFLVFSCWARLTGQRAWIKYEGHPFNPFFCNNLNQREDGRQKQQRYSKRSGCGRGSHRPAHTLGQMLPRCRHLEKKTSARLPPTEGHRNTARERSQPMSETNRTRGQQERESRLHMGTPGGKHGRAFWSTLRPRDRSTPTSHRRPPCTPRKPWAGPMPGPPSLCPKGKSSKSMPTRPRAATGPRAMGRRGLTGTGHRRAERSQKTVTARGPAALPHVRARAPPCASVGVGLPHEHDKLRTGRLYKTSRGGRILFILLGRACPWPPHVPASDSHS